MNEVHPQLASGRRPLFGPEVRQVIAMSIPVVITTSSRAVMDVTDYVMISMLPTTDPQAAILPAQVIMWAYIIMGIGVVSMVNTFSAQCLGRGEKRECGVYAWQSVYLSLMFGLPAAALIPLIPSLVAWVGHAPAVQAAEIDYLKYAILTTGPTIASSGLGWYFIGIHRPWITTWSALESIMVNATVSYVLIFGYLGFPEMGISGAAIGTVVATSFRTVRLAVTMLLPGIHREYGTRDTWRPAWAPMIKLLRYGLPFGLQITSEVVVWAIFVNVLIGRLFGTADLIATNTAWQYLRIAFVPSLGVGQALTALVGKSLGAGDPQRAMREVRIATIITNIYMGSLAVLYIVLGQKLIALFNDTPEVVAIGGWVMVCAGVFQLFDALGITYSSALRGAGDTFIPSIFFIASQWVIIVGGGWAMVALVPQLGSIGPWIAAATLIIITAGFLWWRWHGRAWMKIDIFGEKAKEKLAMQPAEDVVSLGTPG